jgi:cell wall assembly regulator SMI1
MSNSMNEPDFEEEDSATIAPATDEAVQRSEQILGVRLPDFYKRLLKVRNGGVPYRRCFDVDSQLNQLIYWNEIRRLVGVGGMRAALSTGLRRGLLDTIAALDVTPSSRVHELTPREYALRQSEPARSA